MNNPRQAAAACVHAVCEGGESLDTALTTFSADLAESDLSLYRALCYGSVRWYSAYLPPIRQHLKKPFKPKDRILYAVLVSALYQLDETRQSPHAVVNEAVGLAKAFRRQWATGLVNALLRGRIREPEAWQAGSRKTWIRSAFPSWMITQFELAWPQQLDDILGALQENPPMTLRVNRRSTTQQAYLKLLAEHDITALPCQHGPWGMTLTQPLGVNRLPGFDTAQLSIQDESAQLAVPLMDLQPGQRVLDACAAPGGKSLHILETEPNIDELTVVDFPERMPRLRENFQRAGLHATMIEGDLLDSDNWNSGTRYDRILVDAPCTGTGVIRRHPDIKFRRQEENGLQFANNQLKLLSQAWLLLKPGGKLLYTTCSILPVENEHCVARFKQQTPDAKAMELPENLGFKTEHGRQRLPGVHPGDGFFYALLKKTEDS